MVMNFYFLAGLSWAYLLLELYHAYCALERAQEGGLVGDLKVVHA